MSRTIPEKLNNFLKNAFKDVDDGFEYASELNRILSSDECQLTLKDKEIETLREYAEKVRKEGEINYNTEQRIKEIEKEFFGNRGISGYLETVHEPKDIKWPF